MCGTEIRLLPSVIPPPRDFVGYFAKDNDVRRLKPSELRNMRDRVVASSQRVEILLLLF